MHEFGVMKAVLDHTLKQLAQVDAKSVESLRFRRGSAFSEEALYQAFAAVAAGTILEKARVEVETVNLDHNCPCGFSQVITSDDLIGHMFVCPRCGTIREIDEADDLELVEAIIDSANNSSVQGAKAGHHGLYEDGQVDHAHHTHDHRHSHDHSHGAHGHVHSHTGEHHH